MNQVSLTYNDFGQIIGDRQSHSGAVDVNDTPQVQYVYADGSNNTIRPTALVYPNGRVITYDYDTTDSMNDAASRIVSLVDDDENETHLVDYDYLGLGSFVGVTYPEPNVKYTLADLTNTNDPDTGDIYSGLDRFGRVKDCRWYNATEEEDVVRLKYGYDRASNRIWRADLVAQSLEKEFDELYSYDGLHRLKDMQRGLLNGTNTAITSPTFKQEWSLDKTSNWTGFKEADTGGSWTLDQTREANPVNEITDITNTVGATWAQPTHDQAGNMTTIPKPANPTESFTATYDPWNRLVKLVDNDTEETVQENLYDSRTFRVVRKDYEEGDLSETRHYFYTTNWQDIEERLGSSPSTADVERQFVWGKRYIDDLSMRERDTDGDGSLDERLYGLQDANWNTATLTDDIATVQERYAYTAFGTPIFFDTTLATIRTSSDVDIDVLFTGQRFENSTRLNLFRWRAFDSNAGLSVTRDPLGYPDGPNMYTGYFVPDSVDPKGLQGSVRPVDGGEVFVKENNCLGHAFDAGGRYQPDIGLKFSDMMANNGYKCSKADSPSKCVSDCKDKRCAFVYIYIKDKEGITDTYINDIKDNYSTQDWMKFVWNSDKDRIDFHALRGVSVDENGVCKYTHVFGVKEDRNAEKSKPKEYTAKPEEPEVIEVKRILARFCCCGFIDKPYRNSL